jgi:alkyldihydroxyacetonephosphate synthase
MAAEMRWWGWGEDARASPPSAGALAWLERELGALERPRAPVALEDVALGESRLPSGLRGRFAEIVRDDRAARVVHARGKSYPDLLRQRSGDCVAAPDAVLSPRDHGELRAVIEACSGAGVAVVPFGGGTSVVGGLEPRREGFGALVSLDLGALDAVERVDDGSQLAVVGGGLRVAELEARLAERGLMLGHRPQSFEYVSVGGCVATRSAGQASTGYGRIDDMVVGATLAAPAGDLELPAQPSSAAGPDLRRLIIGSEGTLGVIARVALRVRALPELTRLEGWALPSFGAGADVLRRLAQEDLAPTVARLSDEAETRMGVGLAALGRARRGALDGYLRLRGVDEGSLAIIGWEGGEDRVRSRRDAAIELLREGGAIALGRAPARAWERSRFHGPYLRDELIARGVLIDTLETAATWSELLAVHRAVGAALRAHAAIVGCHLSHLYATGASLYFTFVALARPGEELEQWSRAKRAASEAIVAAGATISHHHGVGVDHAPYLRAEVGDRGLSALRALKRELDPAGVMNPGKLLGGG